MTTRLPAKPPPADKLHGLLVEESRAVLTLHGRPRPELGDVINAAMRSPTNERIPLMPSARADHITRWIRRHCGPLRDILTGLVMDRKLRLAATIAARLLLLAPEDADGGWVDGLGRLGTGAVSDSQRAVLCELAARCHIAAGRLTEADALHGVELELLRAAAEVDGSYQGVLPLLWRRTRLHWIRRDWPRVLHWLDAIRTYLRSRPDSRQAQLRGIAHGEVLFAMGQDHNAAVVLNRAIALDSHPDTLLARVDAHLTAGHALHAASGHQTANEQWTHARNVLLPALDGPLSTTFDDTTRDGLIVRLGHVEDLLNTPVDSRPARREDFTVLGPNRPPRPESSP